MCEPFWEELCSHLTLIDSLENAEETAINEIFNCSGEIIDESIMLKWIRRTAQALNARFIEPHTFEIRYADVKCTDEYEVIDSPKVLQIDDYYLAQDKEFPHIWYMGVQENDHVNCWASYRTLEDALKGL